MTPPNDEPLSPFDEARIQIEANSIALTQKFQAAAEAALDECVTVDKQTGVVTGFSFHGGRADQLKKVTESYQAFATAEAARRTSMRQLPAPNIHLTRPSAQQLTPAAGTEPAGMEPLHDGP